MAERRRSRLTAILLASALLLPSCTAMETRQKEQADGYYRMANAHLQQGRGIQDETNRRNAYAELVNAIRLDPGNAQYHLLLGTIYQQSGELISQQSGELISAERELKRTLELDPDLGEAHNNLGTVYSDQGRLSEAIGEYEKALENFSYRTPEIAYFNLGLANYRLGDYAAAARAFGKSLDIVPTNVIARFQQGQSYARLGRLPEAVTAFTQALELEPGSARIHYEQGVVLNKLNRKEAAASHFEKVVELEPDSDMAQQARTFIKLLR
jgi:Tfp pilus assembly protein PilF